MSDQRNESLADLLDPVSRLTRDLRNAATTLSPDEARFLVDAYYAMQRDRIRAEHQERQLAKGDEPHDVMSWLASQRDVLEQQVRRALDAYSGSHLVGIWARSIVGIGPVIAAGLLANIDISRAPTVGHIWRYAGLDPTVKRGEKGVKRSWNGSLKRLCFLIGESFVKVSNNENDVYGKIFRARKAFEVAKNDQGDYADQAKTSLAERNFGEDTDARQWYEGCYPAGTMAKVLLLDADKRAAYLKSVKVKPGKGVQMLPPARIHLRSHRYAVKVFLAHLHHVWYETVFGKAPDKPYVLTEGAHLAYPELAVHTHYIAPPNWPMS
jgi:hypothetical protein